MINFQCPKGAVRGEEGPEKMYPDIESFNLQTPKTVLLIEEILQHLMGRPSPYLQGILHSRWRRMSSINSSKNGRPPKTNA